MDMYLEQMKHIFIGWSTLKYDIVSVETAVIFFVSLFFTEMGKKLKKTSSLRKRKKWLNMKHIPWNSNFKMKTKIKDDNKENNSAVGCNTLLSHWQHSCRFLFATFAIWKNNYLHS